MVFKEKRKGFTLIELLIVIAIITILASIVLVALDPLVRFREARDATRWSDITAIADAIKINQVDNGGEYLFAITDGKALGVEYLVSNATTTSGCDRTCNNISIGGSECVNLIGLVNNGNLGVLPVSPNGVQGWSEEYTGYYLTRNTNGSITIGACEAENVSSISVTR